MKRITVGRGNDCDIVILDDTDNVSRHHLVITFNLLGKMKVSDTSSNGTFINGNRMLKGASIPVSTQDKIRLGRSIELDWNQIKDPYKSARTITFSALIVLVLAVAGISVWYWHKEKSKTSVSSDIEMISADVNMDDTWNKDSTAKVAPIATSIDVNDKKKAPAQKIDRKKKDVKKVNKIKKATEPSIEIVEDNSELDSVAVF